MADINYSDLPIKTGPTVSGDFVIITDSEDGDKVKIQDASLFKGPKGDDGDPGTPGDNAPEVEIEFSIDGATLWHTSFATGDFYQRISTDGGSTWSSAIKFVGEDGTGSGDMQKADYDPANKNAQVAIESEVVLLTGDQTKAGKLTLTPSSAGGAEFNLGGVGVAPTSPVDGDMWIEGTSMLVRCGASTRTLGTTGNLTTVTQANAEAGTETTVRGWTAQRVKQAIDYNITGKASLSGATFTGDVIVPTEAYGTGWNGSNEVPTKNDVYDKIETLSGGGTDTGQVYLNTRMFL